MNDMTASKMKSRTFSSKRGADRFANELKKAGRLDIQVWEMTCDNNGSFYVVLWDA